MMFSPIDSESNSNTDGSAGERTQELDCLIADLASPDLPRRTEAARQIRALRPEAADLLRSLLEPGVRRKDAWRQPLGWLHICAVAVMLGIGCACLARMDPALLALLPLGLAGLCAVLLLSRDRLPARDRARIRALAPLLDKRSIPMLMDLRVLAAGLPEDRLLADRIAQLFQTLEPGDAALFSPEHRLRIHGALQLAAGSDSDYFVAVLRGLQVAGDHTSIPVVARLAQSDAKSRVGIAARECLPHLHARAAREGRTLLRPAGPERPDEEILVRPAANSATADTALLRPIEHDRHESR